MDTDWKLNLRLFGGDALSAGGTAGAGEGDAGNGAGQMGGGPDATAEPISERHARRNPLKDVRFGVQENAGGEVSGSGATAVQNAGGEGAAEAAGTEGTAAQPETAAKENQGLIAWADVKKRYAQEYERESGERIAEAVKARVKNLAPYKARMEALEPALRQLASQLGMDEKTVETPEGAKALADRYLSDDRIYEAEAKEIGAPASLLRELRQLQRESQERQQREAAARMEQEQERAFRQLVEQGEQAKKVYPGFDLRTELGNKDFARLVNAGIDAKSAYEVVHREEINQAMMGYAAQRTQQQIASSLASGARPAENAARSQSGQQRVITDPRTMTREERRELRRRVENGEKISW